MAANRKYHSEEEGKEAQRRWAREYRARHKDRIRQREKDRYHADLEASRRKSRQKWNRAPKEKRERWNRASNSLTEPRIVRTQQRAHYFGQGARGSIYERGASDVHLQDAFDDHEAWLEYIDLLRYLEAVDRAS